MVEGGRRRATKTENLGLLSVDGWANTISFRFTDLIKRPCCRRRFRLGEL